MYLLGALCILLAVAKSALCLCRCRPHEACWPSLQEWSTLNSSIHGNLVAVRPVASPCHAEEFDEQRCTEVQQSWSDATWRASEPGALMLENWESWPERHEACYIQDSTNTTCGQGRISLYAAKVESVAQIQETVGFAKRHHLRLVIKNSGHDFLGRSSAPESLQIFTHDMRSISVVDDFMPSGAPPHSTGQGPAVTIEAGVSVGELYAEVGRHNRSVIAGAASTIGAAGGYVQGGGHSVLGVWGGMASDNALEFQIVLASGQFVTANAHQNQDLFWALRGGGGGTFGVVTSVTLKTMPEVPAIVASLNITASSGDHEFWDGLTEFHRALPSLNGAGGGGFYFAVPNQLINDSSSMAVMSSILIFANHTNLTQVDALYGPLRSSLAHLPDISIEYGAFALPSIQATLSSIFFSTKPVGGEIGIVASRLYSKDLLMTDDGPERLTNAWSSLEYEPGRVIAGCIVAGGAVAAHGHSISSALNPAWRKAITHMIVSKTWSANTTVAAQYEIAKNISQVELPIIQSVEGQDRMGAYMNEAFPEEPGFQASFWGENYIRLYDIKHKVDPTGLFITRLGVASEDWDDTGFCRR